MLPADSSSAALIASARALPIPGTDPETIARLATAIKQQDLGGISGLKPLRLQLLAGVTSDYLRDFLQLMLVRAGYAPVISGGCYGGLVRGLMGESPLDAQSSDAAVVVLTFRDLQFPPDVGIDAAEARARVGREVDFWAGLLARSSVPTVLLSFDLPARRVLDEQDGLAPGGLGWHIKMTNLELAQRLAGNVSMVDAEALQFRIGAAGWHDDRLYHLCKQPFSMEALPEVAHALVAALVGLLGRARKVLVLDLDNTLWGGVIGDDGLQGIELGPETPEGEAYAAFQAYARSLAQRGIVLAVCSKNRDEAARSPFREHSGMVLKEEDIACFVANFQDKAANLRYIARTLNLGLDSLVFVDDNPVERALVRSELPEVLVVEVPDDPAGYAAAVEAARAFPLRTLTREDLGRVGSYRAMAEVRNAAASETDMEQFLVGLEPVAHVQPADTTAVDRIVQLVKKTNQFKLNPTLFNEQEILALAPGVVALRLADRLQDYGIVAIAVTRPEGQALRILNWVMSCRVFGRRLEHVTVELLDRIATQHGCSVIVGDYQASEKNVILPDILASLGFAADANGHYQRPTGQALALPHHMKIPGINQ